MHVCTFCTAGSPVVRVDYFTVYIPLYTVLFTRFVTSSH